MNTPVFPSPSPFSSQGGGGNNPVPISYTREELAELVFQQRAGLFGMHNEGPHLMAYNQDYSHMDLDYLYLASSQWTDCSLIGTHLRFASLGKLPLFRNCLLTGATMHGQLVGLRLEECVAVSTRFVDAIMSQSCLIGSPFTLLPLLEASFAKATLVDSLFANVAAQDTNFAGADLTRTVFHSTFNQYPAIPLVVPNEQYLAYRYVPPFQLGEQDEDQQWTHYLLETCHMSLADTADIDLSRANFRQAICCSTVFRNCRLSGADFTGADLTGTDFRGADLQGVTLNYAQLDGTQFSTIEQLAHTEHFRIRQAVEHLCVTMREGMIMLADLIVWQRPLDSWIAQYMPSEPDMIEHGSDHVQEVLFLRWLGNYDEHLHVGDNPPILLLLRWINDVCDV